MFRRYARTRLKNRIHSVLNANLLPSYRGDLFSAPGRAWLNRQPLDDDEREAVWMWLEELDRLGVELERVDQLLAKAGLASGDLMWALLKLEMLDRIRQLPGKSFVRRL